MVANPTIVKTRDGGGEHFWPPGYGTLPPLRDLPLTLYFSRTVYIWVDQRDNKPCQHVRFANRKSFYA